MGAVGGGVDARLEVSQLWVSMREGGFVEAAGVPIRCFDGILHLLKCGSGQMLKNGLLRLPVKVSSGTAAIFLLPVKSRYNDPLRPKFRITTVRLLTHSNVLYRQRAIIVIPRTVTSRFFWYCKVSG